MANYANQNSIEITNEIIEKVAHAPGGTEKFLRPIKWEYIRLAQQVLTGNEFALLVYILQWAGQGSYEFSPAGIEIETQMSDSTAKRAFKRLCEIGYIEQGAGTHRFKVNLYPKGIEELAQEERSKKLVGREIKNNNRKERRP